jgi:hypothetical protein
MMGCAVGSENFRRRNWRALCNTLAFMAAGDEWATMCWPTKAFHTTPVGDGYAVSGWAGIEGGVRIAGGLGFLCQDLTLPCCQATCLNFADTFRCGANHFARYSQTKFSGDFLRNHFQSLFPSFFFSAATARRHWF